METNSIHPAERILEDSGNRNSAGPGITATFAWIAAALLILIGAAFELGTFGLGPYNSSDAWLFSSIGRNVWIVLTNLFVPELGEHLKVWPLVLVSFGSAILLLARLRNRIEPSAINIAERSANRADRY